MPFSGQVCRKCRIGACQEGDTWCLLCSCVATLGELSRHRFQVPSFRSFAEELVVQTTRQVKAVITLDRQTQAQFTSLTDRLNNATAKLNEASAQPKSAARHRERSAPKAAKEEETERPDRRTGETEGADFGSPSRSSSSEEKVEPAEEKGKAPEAERAASARGSERPPEPIDPPPPPPRAAEAPRKRSRSRDRGRRGGARHQETFRGLYQPERQFHHRSHLEPVNLGYSGGRRRSKEWR